MLRLVRLLPMVLVLAPSLAGCGYVKGKAVNMVADTLASGGDVFTRDDDPELVEGALPFALKLYESLLESSPKNQKLLVATCAAYTQYGVGFLENNATVLGDANHHEEVVHLKDRAAKMYTRAKGYCLRAMDLRFKGISTELVKNSDAALKKAKPNKKDVPLLYWTAASWGSLISLSLDKPDIAIDLPVVRSLAEQAIALDEAWDPVASPGALHEMMITLDSQPEFMGGSVERARKHFARAVELQKGLSPGPYIALATGVSLAAQDRTEFTKLLKDALAIDPEKDPSRRLVILIGQRRARALLDQIDTLIGK